MASTENFVQQIKDMLPESEGFTFKKMFGEYGIYLNEKVVAMICDNQFLVKVTDKGKEMIRDEKYGEPYPGAKKLLLIDDDLDDQDYVKSILIESEKFLPKPKKKKSKKS